ncbi:MAG: hypothetical protein CSA21_00410 [Deltaproteobacteria bacterium]|nr:MAG: hypothetical protein CSA21_00410 [Deltaproteobacteria bacterium]
MKHTPLPTVVFLFRFFLVVLVMPLNQGCIPVVIAAAGAGGYLLADEEAQDNLKNIFKDISDSLKKQTRGIKSEKETRKDLDYRDDEGFLLEITAFSVKPSEVRCGEEIQVTTQYSILGAPEEGILIRDIKSLWVDNKEIITLADDTIKRNNGTWESTLAFEVPASAAAGPHKIKQKILHDTERIESVGFFTIK